MKTSISLTNGAVAAFAAVLTAGSPAVSLAAPGTAMPVAQQNVLVQKYCAVCHNDAHMNGGLSLQHFDAANLDPGLAAMMVSKLKAGALGASGSKPDKAAGDALQTALTEEAIGANTWTLNRTQNPKTQAPVIIASVVQEVPSTTPNGDPDMYRLILTCQADTREGEIQLAWSPVPPPQGRSMAVAVDGKALLSYKVEGTEKMGNGQSGSSGPGSAIFYTTKNASAPGRLTSLPQHTLTVSDLFPNKTVEFSFSALNQTARQALSTCFTGSRTGH
jgi:hypothetical protein